MKKMLATNTNATECMCFTCLSQQM